MNEKKEFCYLTSYLRWLAAAEKLGYETVEEMLTDLYNNPPRNVNQVGQVVGFTGMSVANTMKRLGVPRRAPVARRRRGGTVKV
jgi:hypothetical protein